MKELNRPVEDFVIEKVYSLEKTKEFIESLSGRQVQVALLLMGGMKSIQIADELGIKRQNISQIIDAIETKAVGIFGSEAMADRARYRREEI